MARRGTSPTPRSGTVHPRRLTPTRSRRPGGEIVGRRDTARHGDMRPSSRDQQLRRILRDLLRQDGVTIGTRPSTGMTKNTSGPATAPSPSHELAGLGRRSRASSASTGTCRCSRGRPTQNSTRDSSRVRGCGSSHRPHGAPADRYVQSTRGMMNFLKLGMTKSASSAAARTRRSSSQLEGLEVKERYDFPQGDKTLRKEDHQPSFGSSSSRSRTASTRSGRPLPKEKDVFRRPATSRSDRRRLKGVRGAANLQTEGGRGPGSGPSFAPRG